MEINPGIEEVGTGRCLGFTSYLLQPNQGAQNQSETLS